MPIPGLPVWPCFMSNRWFRLSLPLGAVSLAVLLFGCRGGGRTPVETTQSVSPEAASVQLEKTFSGSANPAIKQDARIASAALQKRDYEAAFVILRKLQASSGLTDAQDMAVRNALIGLQRELAQAIVNGDQQALETAKRLQRTQ